MVRRLCALVLLALVAPAAGQDGVRDGAQDGAQDGASAPAKPDLSRRTFQVDGVAREALFVVPSTAVRREGLEDEDAAEAVASPLVLVFHGHGGSARGMARKVPLHRHWPEAVVVYPQGLKTPGALTDPEGKKSGWNTSPGVEDNRDLRFVDVLLAKLGEELVLDPRRMHVTGHSNGGGFTYLLWREHGETFASFAPSASGGGKALRDAVFVPRPVLHLGSPDDKLVLWQWQSRTIERVRSAHDCSDGEPWEVAPEVQRYASPTGAHLYVLEHGGGHRMYRKLPEVVTTFFQRHPLPEVDESAETQERDGDTQGSAGDDRAPRPR